MAHLSFNSYILSLLDGIAASYHQLRVLIRRIKPCLKLLIKEQSRSNKRQLLCQSSDVLITLFKTLSQIRDLQVQAELFHSQQIQADEHKIALNHYIEQLETDIKHHQHQLIPIVQSLDVLSAITLIKSDCKKNSQQKKIQAQANVQRKKSQDSYKRSLTKLAEQPETFHKVRIKLKNYRYALELYGQIAKKRKAKRIQQLKEMQEKLGDASDLYNAVRLMQHYQLGEKTINDIRARYLQARNHAIEQLLAQ
ncbi:CHAD domain-containing protein [Celerinatantimonas sp. MCCC 1A17872]|uniref:CHAD domain-containing protein n=1 Tax=Celerinatantimonas sp. MCCC 1A17872 TaxID=3177514 RepID=UPI0038CB26C0